MRAYAHRWGRALKAGRVLTGPAGQRDYELMGLGAVCCSLLHWFKPGRAVGRARDCQDHRCLSRVGALG